MLGQRRKRILAILGTAELTFKRVGIGGWAHRDNGGVMLEAGIGISSFRHNLKFTPNQNENRILCAATIAGFDPQAFELDILTDEAVEDAVKEFGELLGREKVDDSAAKVLASGRQ